MVKCTIECIIAIGEGSTLTESEKDLKEKVNKFNKYGYNLQEEVERSYRIIPLEGKGKGKIVENNSYEKAIGNFNKKFGVDPQTIPVKVEIHAKYKITAKEKKEAKVEGSASPGSYHTNETNIEMVI